jgi:hypothetical protein
MSKKTLKIEKKNVLLGQKTNLKGCYLSLKSLEIEYETVRCDQICQKL